MIDRVRRYLVRRRKIDLSSGFDPNDVKQALDTQVRLITGKVPPEVMAKVLKIRQIILGILPRSGNLPPGSPQLFIIERTATDYLPTSLQAYLNLPRAYATRHPVQDGKTPKEVLLDQLALLETKMNEVADDVHRNDSDRLLADPGVLVLSERIGPRLDCLGLRHSPSTDRVALGQALGARGVGFGHADHPGLF